MRQGQNPKRARGRGRRQQNPVNRTMDSNGPDVKVRGTPQHIFEKYQTLARDAQSSGDRVVAENYLQHAEHYYRVILQVQSQSQNHNGDEGRQNNNGDARRGQNNGQDGGTPDENTDQAPSAQDEPSGTGARAKPARKPRAQAEQAQDAQAQDAQAQDEDGAQPKRRPSRRRRAPREGGDKSGDSDSGDSDSGSGKTPAEAAE